MPRPGPRPYECVRRAWHSDRHQPIRGSLIQQIFRMAYEVHSPATRSNREWLEKLPLVVLKAEEIIYSKANSEAEYTDLRTLWDRANEAIDTIIRRDDLPEAEGDLLQPCIEAALNLGCIPRRASRSQRHNNPGCYLSSVREGAQARAAHLWPLSQLPGPHSGNQSSSLSSMESWYSAFLAANKTNRFPDCEFTIPFMGSLLNQDQDTSAIDPQCLPLHDFIGSDAAKNALHASSLMENKPVVECDLSLRLGPFSPSSFDAESAWAREVEDEGSCDGSKYSNIYTGAMRVSSKNKGFDFINVDAATTTDEPMESCSSKWSSEEEVIVVRRSF